jgi:ribosomal protein S18 acetylase RimI-like enzyme
MSIVIRNLTEADVDPADAILMSAYGGPSRSARLRRYLALQAEGWLLAELDGGLAGVAGTINYGPLAYIGLVAVHPSMQRRGVARALMERLLAWLEERGCPLALLDASDAGAPLYVQLGFEDEGKTLVFRRDDCALRPQPSDRVSLLRPADLPALVAFDTPIFGADRAAVFAAQLAEEPERAFVAHDATGQIAGYLFAQTQTLGPWVARTRADAEALLGAALRLEYDGAPGAIVPASNADASRLLMRYGFSPLRSLRHMRRGGNAAPGQRVLLYGQASLAIG